MTPKLLVLKNTVLFILLFFAENVLFYKKDKLLKERKKFELNIVMFL